MLTVISPAKTLDLTPVRTPGTVPQFQADATRLAATARGLSLRDLRGLMDISDALARLNRDRFRAFVADPALDQTKPAVLAFNGDTYIGFDAKTVSDDDLNYAQDHLRILSGLYGLLRPLDAIQPYRLEMGARLKTRRGGSLYDYWGDTVAKALRAQAQAVGTDILINCASQEYFHAANRKSLKLRVITPMFLEDKQGQTSTISFFAKRARGAMARLIMCNRISDPVDIKGFSTGGYSFAPALSDGDTWAFVRPAQPA